MEYPQSYITKILKYGEIIHKYGCLAMCYLYCMGISERCMIEILCDTLEYDKPQLTGLDEDCTINDAVQFIYYVSGRKVNVFKENPLLKEIKTPTPVRFTKDNNNHWVVVKNGKIAFNSLEWSNCVENGKPIPLINDPYARVIKFV